MEKKIRLNILLPLLGVTVAWVAMVLASYFDLSVASYWDQPNFAEVKASTYAVLAGLVIGSLLALWGFKRADAAHAADEKTPLIRAEYRFTALMIILGMAFLAIFAIVTFIGSFGTSSFDGASPTVVGRILGVYLPIVLAAGAVVFVLLQATLYRKTSPVDGVQDKGLSATQKALAIGYAVPIVGTAFAIIVGLIVYDTQSQKLATWAWVVIQLIIGTSIYFGTRSAAKARSAKPVVRAPRVVGAAGAVTLNYVLSLIFAGAVSVMSFTFATAAVSSLRIYRECVAEVPCVPVVNGTTAQWWMEEMIPAFLLLVLVQVAVYFVITARNKAASSSI